MFCATHRLDLLMKCTATTDLKPYIAKLTRDQKKVLAANPDKRHLVVNCCFNQNETFRCHTCNKLMLDFFDNNRRVTCSDVCKMKAKAHMTGKKRPEHSALMKKKIPQLIKAGKFWTAEHRANNKKHLAELNQDHETREVGNATRKSIGAKRKRLVTMLNSTDHKYMKHPEYVKSPLSKLTERQIAKASEVQINRWVRQLNSLKTLTAMQRNPNMGATQFYKRIVMKGLKYHVRRKSITTRSSLEYNFVKWVETNGHRWCYEWTRIELGNGSVHIPDFKVQIGKDVWVVETKGFYRRKPGSAPLSFKKEKVTAAWCRSRGYRYVVLDFAQIGKLGNKINLKKWIDLTFKTDKQIVSYLKHFIPGAKDASNRRTRS